MIEGIINIIKNAGIVGGGGAGLPTHIKADTTVDTVLVNGASCEPLLMSDPYLIENSGKKMLQGVVAMMDATQANRGIVCLKAKHKAALKSLRTVVEEFGDPRIEIFELENFYPVGDEHVLVHEVLDRTIPQGRLPLHVGAVVSNVETFYNIGLALDNIPVTDRYLTVFGAVKTPMVIRVSVGTTASEVIEYAGGATIDNYVVVDGGPMMGRVLSDINEPITKKTSGILVLPPEHTVVAGKIMAPQQVRKFTTSICCQCTLCTELCPRYLLGHDIQPHKLTRIRAEDILNSKEAHKALLCSECGVCEKFACPMGLSPRELNAQIKKTLREGGIRLETTGESQEAHPFRVNRRIPTQRLIQRLDLEKYDINIIYGGELVPDQVSIPLSQHIGAPAICLVKVGDSVEKGQCIGEIPEGSMGSRIHSSISGVVSSITNNVITIKK
ncbi:4Fe-4S dicluster domain-containing protein [Moritella yayanosii]|uniref:Putative Propanediol utilization protein, PduS n=1 Tax=Moritella yayanosii TaxID=69539 RepID=A0A330LQ19_9GAMM|nr:4Fe-4S dicluster domain-containing protein [Moritella yayanosii]SQD78739.1 putative Propanediol utilization protein, PduS [Moritella yayanosii]